MNRTAQQLVNGLSATVGRPAMLEDAQLRLIVYGPHGEPLDAVREASILNHGASPAVRRYLMAHIRDATGPVRVPGNSDLGMLSRVCVPIRQENLLLGYMWFVDPDNLMTAADLSACLSTATELAPLLAGTTGLDRPGVRVAELTSVLLTASPETAQIAGRNLQESGYLQGGRDIAVVVFSTLQGQVSPLHDGIRMALRDPEIGLLPTHTLQVTLGDQCVVLVSGPEVAHSHFARTTMIQARAQVLFQASHFGQVDVVAGLGTPRTELSELPAAFQEARSALRAAMTLPDIGRTVSWSELGVFDTVVKVASAPNAAGAVHHGLLPLFDSPESSPLLETMETYLDLGGNAQLAAERLNLHRTSLYYRLQRVEQLTGASLKNGVDRLSLHLSMKIARMHGLYRPRHAPLGPTDGSSSPERNSEPGNGFDGLLEETTLD